jgi:hypothetical protein
MKVNPCGRYSKNVTKAQCIKHIYKLDFIKIEIVCADDDILKRIQTRESFANRFCNKGNIHTY